MQDIILENTDPEVVATAAEMGSEEERMLAEEIARLWEVHVQAKGVVKKTKEELKAIRERLSKRLYEMKLLLSRPGRCGQWSPWLKERHISRATADRLVQRFAATLPGFETPHEAISALPIDAAEELAKGLWPSLKKVLRTNESVIQFIACVADISGVHHEKCPDGLLIFNPVPKVADGLPGSDPAPQLSSEVPAITG